MPAKQAIFRTLFWIISACVFCFGIYQYAGIEKAAEFMSVYVAEKLLSLDNLFVFLMIFSHFNVPEKDRRKVLNYGLVGAVVLRALCIGAGIAIVQQFNWILYGLGALLIYSAVGVVCAKDDDIVEESKIIKFAKSLSVPELLVWIVAIELSDITFAIDSIPVGLSISQDMFIVYTANIFAILGLRSFYFVIQSAYDVLPQLKYGIGLILAFIGVKMFLPLIDVHFSATHSLAIVVSILACNMFFIIRKKLEEK